MNKGINEEISIDWLSMPAAAPDEDARRAAEMRQALLTKPPGALGRLEEIAIRLAAMQGTTRPTVDRVRITVFAADHGVAVEGVSAFPQSVTHEMVKNFACGGAAIGVAARAIGAELEVINLGTVGDSGTIRGVKNLSLGPGTANFVCHPAMTKEQLSHALAAGRQAVERARLGAADLFIGGEMGIGNTTAASALACVLLDGEAEQFAGRGTGLDDVGLARKIRVIRRALELHGPNIYSPLDALKSLGGFEIAALTGAYLTCAHMALPALVDGFISSVAALVAKLLCPGADRWFIFSHLSAESGHRRVLEALNSLPLLDLGMRLGEGSGAAVAVPLLRMACTLHNDMATFSEAGISRTDL